jgi:hypothetical protein
MNRLDPEFLALADYVREHFGGRLVYLKTDHVQIGKAPLRVPAVSGRFCS